MSKYTGKVDFINSIVFGKAKFGKMAGLPNNTENKMRLDVFSKIKQSVALDIINSLKVGRYAGRLDISSLGEVVEIGGSSSGSPYIYNNSRLDKTASLSTIEQTTVEVDNLKVVLGVIAHPLVVKVLEESIGRDSFSVDTAGYLIIPKQLDQEKAVAAVNREFGLKLRLLREIECDILERIIGTKKLREKIKAFWTSARNILRRYLYLFDFGRRKKGEHPEARLVVGVLSRALALAIKVAPKKEGLAIAIPMPIPIPIPIPKKKIEHYTM